jgi:neutral ceramidase
MRVGTSQVDITPKVGVELSGFAARTQPSTGVLDRLYVRGLHLVAGKQRLLWLHGDLLGLDREMVRQFRAWADSRLGLTAGQVMLSATHTHSGPAVLHLREAGTYDPAYVEFLLERLKTTAKAAVESDEECRPVAVEGRCELAVDRRKQASSHTDPRVAAVGFRRADGTFAAVILNYAMHAVALGPTNRQISADIPGRTAAALTEDLPGRPLALVTNGACGNLNPPAENVPPSQIEAWGREVADGVIERLKAAGPMEAGEFRMHSRVLPLPVEALSVEEIDAYAAKAIEFPKPLAEWGDKYRRAVAGWRESMTRAVREGRAGTAEAELFAIRLGPVVLLGLNAEVFSQFADLVRDRTGRTAYIVGYSNGDMGYLPTRAAYEEGGYEVEIAHLFYDAFRVKPGGLERLVDAAAKVVEEVF